MKRTTKKQKLTLNRETVRQLSKTDLIRAAGGVAPTGCVPNCVSDGICVLQQDPV